LLRVRLPLAFLCLAAFLGAPAPAPAQDSVRLSLIVEPGFLTRSAVSAVEGAATLTAFYVRAMVTAGRDSSRWRGVLGAGVTPFGFRGSGVRNQNAPSVFGGIQFEALPSRLTDGWGSLYVPLFIVYSYGGGATENTRLYGADVTGEVTLIVRVGEKLFDDLGSPWSRVAAFISAAQNLTPNVENATGKRDRFRPDFMYGLSLPLSGRR
jgi:hypothetical protein